MLPAILNGFPLVFPDSGTYLGIAFAHDYAVDRSSFYGLMLKPFVNALPGVAGLWLAIAVQAGIVATATLYVAREFGLRNDRAFVTMIAVAALTALPWHAGQFMPDAFTGALALLTTLAALRDPGENGAASLWLGATALALTHYTHLVLLPVAAGAAIAAQGLLGLGLRAIARRVIAAMLATALAAGTMIAANGAALQRWTISPVGSVFLFARLNEDGLIAPWIARHCGRDAPAELCAVYPALPKGSQALLWGGTASPVTGKVWGQDDATRWRWAAMMGAANRGAIAERPLDFLSSALRGGTRQLLTFAAVDDECPHGCIDPAGGITGTIAAYRPALLPLHLGSGQARGLTPKAMIRAVSTPVAALALLLLLPALWLAWRKRDRLALAFGSGVTATLIANAALAGALSDVHDRYQSRVVWLAPFFLLLLALRWRAEPCPMATPDA